MILGTMLFDDAKYDAAIDLFDQAITHHPGLFFPKAHNLLARAYALSGRKAAMLARMKKDVAALSAGYYNLATALECDGNTAEAVKNYELFLKYTDNRSLRWLRREPGVEPIGDAGTGPLLRAGEALRVWSWDGGADVAAGGATPGAAAPEPAADLAARVPEEDRANLVTTVVATGDRIYYGLRNGYLVGRAKATGERTWAYRLRGVPKRSLVVGPGVLAAADDKGTVFCLGLREGSDPSDVSAYLRLAQIAARAGKTEEAEGLYRYLVEEVKFNVPVAWHALWQMAEARGDADEAARRRRNYEESQF
jgi:tetratricopeptide (TPR) repeat protein